MSARGIITGTEPAPDVIARSPFAQPLPRVLGREQALKLMRMIWRDRALDITIDHWIADHERDWPERCRLTFLYAVQVQPNGPVKFGLSDNPDARLNSLQVGNHEELAIVAAVYACRYVEEALLGDLYAHRIRGEWFRPDHRVLETVDLLSEIEWEDEE